MGTRFWLHEPALGLTSPNTAGVRTAGTVPHMADVDAHVEWVWAAGETMLWAAD